MSGDPWPVSLRLACYFAWGLGAGAVAFGASGGDAVSSALLGGLCCFLSCRALAAWTQRSEVKRAREHE